MVTGCSENSVDEITQYMKQLVYFKVKYDNIKVVITFAAGDTSKAEL